MVAPPLRINSHLSIPGNELRIAFAHSGGPGGQHVNKVESKVLLRFSVTDSRVLGERRKSLIFKRLAARLTGEGEILIQSARYRQQARNLEDARQRLAALLAEALRPVKARKKTRPSRASKERRLQAKRRRSEVKRMRRGRED